MYFLDHKKISQEKKMTNGKEKYTSISSLEVDFINSDTDYLTQSI